MGKRGPQPAPTPLRVLRGDRPSRVNPNEPQPDVPLDPLAAPAWMNEQAKEIWDSLAPQMHRKGVLSEWDVPAFAVFCEALVHHRLACEVVDASAVLIRGRRQDGALVKNPALQVIRDSAAIIRGFAQEFGMTPAARSGIELPLGDEFEQARKLLS